MGVTKEEIFQAVLNAMMADCAYLKMQMERAASGRPYVISVEEHKAKLERSERLLLVEKLLDEAFEGRES
jgi:hypothetical protein